METKIKDREADMTNDYLLSPPPSYSSVSGTQILDVHYIGWSSHISITDSTGQQVFLSQAKGCSTRLEIMSRNNNIIGHSKANDWSAKVNVEMNGAAGVNHAFEIRNSAGILGGSPRFTSPAFNGQLMTWKNKAMASNIIYTLIDERGTALAKFESDRKTKIGKLEITDQIAGEDQLNEVVVTLLTLLHRKLRNIEAAYVAAIT